MWVVAVPTYCCFDWNVLQQKPLSTSTVQNLHKQKRRFDYKVHIPPERTLCPSLPTAKKRGKKRGSSSDRGAGRNQPNKKRTHVSTATPRRAPPSPSSPPSWPSGRTPRLRPPTPPRPRAIAPCLASAAERGALFHPWLKRGVRACVQAAFDSRCTTVRRQVRRQVRRRGTVRMRLGGSTEGTTHAVQQQSLHRSNRRVRRDGEREREGGRGREK